MVNHGEISVILDAPFLFAQVGSRLRTGRPRADPSCPRCASNGLEHRAVTSPAGMPGRRAPREGRCRSRGARAARWRTKWDGSTAKRHSVSCAIAVHSSLAGVASRKGPPWSVWLSARRPDSNVRARLGRQRCRIAQGSSCDRSASTGATSRGVPGAAERTSPSPCGPSSKRGRTSRRS